MPKKLSQEEFIAKAVAVHGVGRYDYSQIADAAAWDRVCIICPTHGEFKQNYRNHLQGAGCPQCGRIKMGPPKKTLQDFVEEANRIHQDKYDYSQSEYCGCEKTLKIKCPTHGVFEQKASHHLRGKGCQQCGLSIVKAIHAARTYSTEDFIGLANTVHKNCYNYSLAEYKGSCHKVSIICPTHGIFRQVAARHLSGAGCPSCGIAKLKGVRRGAHAKFIAKATELFGDRYDYSRVEYHGSRPKVKIICRQHGEFEQEPSNHINGHGCPQCGSGERELTRQQQWIKRAAGKTAVLYFLRVFSDSEEFFKVGITCNLQKRFRGTGIDLLGYQYEVLAKFKSNDTVRVFDWEQSIISTFSHLRYRPKKAFSGSTECFVSASEILAIFPL